MSDIQWQPGKQYREIVYETYEGIAKITINRPSRRNAFTPLTVNEMYDAFSVARDDASIGVIILTGANHGGRHEDEAFCSGGDQKIRGNGGYVGEDNIPRLNVLDLQRLIRVVPKPVIAMVNGYAIGGGHVLHILCDLSIAAETAKFGQTGPKVGSFDAGYGAGYLAAMVGQSVVLHHIGQKDGVCHTVGHVEVGAHRVAHGVDIAQTGPGKGDARKVGAQHHGTGRLFILAIGHKAAQVAANQLHGLFRHGIGKRGGVAGNISLHGVDEGIHTAGSGNGNALVEIALAVQPRHDDDTHMSGCIKADRADGLIWLHITRIGFQDAEAAGNLLQKFFTRLLPGQAALIARSGTGDCLMDCTVLRQI